MLKNKFGMTKVLVLVLSVLMLVSLVACNKADGPSTDDMNAAIQAAIDAANAEQAAKEAALAASIAADKAAQEAKDAAQAESLAKEKAENDAALKKAQEEAAAAAKKAEEASKAAADAAKKAAEEAAKAAEEAAKANEAALKKAQEEAAAAKKAAEEASKAAAEAAAKAQSEADRVASELAAELEAAKAEALKAQEEAAKAQEEASKAIAEASKAAEEAAKASSQLAETTVVPEPTAPAETTVVVPGETTVAPETTTEAPVVIVDKNDALLAYSQLKVQYTITNKDMYLTNDYAQIVLLFDKASIDLNNAATAEAAASIVSTLEIDAAAVPSVKNAAKDVQALIVDLKDIETEVFTIQADKIKEVRKAYDAFVKAYSATGLYLSTDLDEKIEKLGVNVEDLVKAENKLVVLKAYMTLAFQDDLRELYSQDTRQNYDAIDDTQLHSEIMDLYYKYLVLVAINGGNIDDADVVVEYEQKRVVTENPDGTTTTSYENDYDKPLKWFTIEDLLNVYILPTLDAKLAVKAEIIWGRFDNAINSSSAALMSNLNSLANKPAFSAIRSDLNAISDKLLADYSALSFVEDFKGSNTLADAEKELAIMAIEAYLDALNVYFAETKEVYATVLKENAQTTLTALDTQITRDEAALEDATAISAETLKKSIAKNKAEVARVEAELAATLANIEAATLYTYDELLSKDLDEIEDIAWADLTDISFDNSDEIANYLYSAVIYTVNHNFVSEINVAPTDPNELKLETLRANAIADLTALIKRLSPYAGEYGNPTIDDSITTIDERFGDIFWDLKTTYDSYIVDEEGNSMTSLGIYKNAEDFANMIKAIEAAIAEINAVTADGEAKLNPVMKDDTKAYYFKDAQAYDYAVKNYEYSPADVESILAVIEADEKLVKDSATSYPVQYEVTAIEQAIEKIAKLYVDAYKALNTSLVGISSVKDDINDDKKDITDTSDGGTPTAYDNLVKTVSGSLKDEMETVKKAYIAKLEALVTDFSKNSTLKVDSIYKDVKKSSAVGTNKTFIQINVELKNADGVAYAAEYDYNKFDESSAGIVNEFNTKFFGTGATGTDKELLGTANSTVSALWTLKLNAVNYINTTIAGYKNTYSSTANGITAAAPSGQLYKYGATGTAGAVQPDYVAEYEDKLDALASEYIEKIMNLQIGSDAEITVANPAGGNFKVDDIEIKKIKINYSLTNADQIIEAYKMELFGTAGTYAHANNAVQNATNCFDQGNSKIFQAYNSIVLGNTYGITYKTGATHTHN